MTTPSPYAPLTLPNGAVLANRFAKAAMEENMADADHAPSEALVRLYQRWAQGGVGLIITGNVMIDPRAMTGPGGVVLANDRHAERFRAWAQAARSHGAHVWMQINHPGRQMPAAMGQATLAPSAVGLDLGSYSKQFPKPRAMTAADIEAVRQSFIRTAVLAQQFGFTGVQIHAAHGYLLSQFLSPLSNQRDDEWGGSLANRARLLLEVVRGVRAEVPTEFVVSVKLNSADFQRGGFSAAEAQQVVVMLNGLGVDVIELSGGSYEAPAMQGQTRDGRSLAREAYFLEFAQEIAKVAQMPLMVTGGIRRLPIVEHVLAQGIALVGIASALAIQPDLPNQWQRDPTFAVELAPITLKNKVLASIAAMAVIKYQLHRLSQDLATQPKASPILALLRQQLTTALKNRAYRRWVRLRGA